MASKPAKVRRAVETAEAEPRPDKALDTPVVLLDDIVQILLIRLRDKTHAITQKRF